ncbi:pimeloyl-ACP methyl ester carboxylesterase [Sphingomonas sp. PvP055]|uniref:alpha/beta fold hydrolase n=1 Tax=Sphingomonas sp. PvP055 TaxID=3156391 RepID=UPI00339A55B6
MKRLGPILIGAFVLLGTDASGQVPSPKPVTNPALDAYASGVDSVRLADGRTIHLTCMGTGSPTVILTAGLGDWGVSWSLIQPDIAKHTRVCAWDRAGFGLSSPSEATQTVDATAADLEAALRRGRIAGPYVLVGHSMGAYESLRFADRHRGQVAGMVLVDPSFPGQAAQFARELPAFNAAGAEYEAGGLRAMRHCADLVGGADHSSTEVGRCVKYPADFPPLLRATITQRSYDPARFRSQVSLSESFDRSSAIVVDPRRRYGAMPLRVLTASDGPDLPPDLVAARAELPRMAAIWSEEHDRLAALSTIGTNRIVEGTSHYIHRIKPERVVAEVDAVIDAARAKSPRK